MKNKKYWYLSNNIDVAGCKTSYDTFIAHCLDIALDYVREKYYCFPTVSVNVNIVENFKQLYPDDDCIAYVWWLDDGMQPREFEFQINRSMLELAYSKQLSRFNVEFRDQDPFEILFFIITTTIAHEAVHIAQMASGRYFQVPSENTTHIYWDEKRIENLSYDEEPWEIEAYQLEPYIATHIRQQFT